jgi:formylglycine-generating enzyme required for sulfatase activity
LVDDAPSMTLWRQTVDEFIALLSGAGIFRNVQRWTLAVVEAEGAVNDERQTELRLYPEAASPGDTRRQHDAAELLDQQRRRLFLLVTDCSSIVWDSGAAQRFLQPLAASNLVSLVQLLPETLWPTTALGLARETRLTSTQPLATNAQLFPGQNKNNDPYPIPVVSLEPDVLRLWAGFLAGRERRSQIAYYLPTDDDAAIDVDAALRELGITPQPVPVAADVDPAELYNRFRARVPQRARPLAAYFAAAPLTLSVMRMVQAALLPRATHADFVHVFYSGLLQRVTAQTEARPDSEILYDFVGGDAMRRYLLARLPNATAEQVVELVITELSRYVRENLEQPGGFDAILTAPGASGMLQVDVTARYFAQVTAQMLRYLGGVYATFADNLESLILPQPPLDAGELAAAEADRAAALATAAVQSWRGLQESARSLLENSGESDIRTLLRTDPAQPPMRLQTSGWLDGRATQQIPSNASSEIRRAHELEVKLLQSLRPQMSAFWRRITAPGLAVPPEITALPHILVGAPPLKLDWCWIPDGKFQMGGEHDYDGKPIHTVDVAGFWLARYPATNEQFRLFIAAGGYDTPDWWTNAGWRERQQEKWSQPLYWQDSQWNNERQPVVGVSWYEAAAFCAWAAGVTGEKIQLPGEAQWEKGAQGSDGRVYPWGKAVPTNKLCNFNGNVDRTTPVGQYSPQGDSSYGCADMSGNVWEWCLSKYKQYPYKEDDGRNNSDGTDVRMVRGGSWYTDRNSARCAYRYWYNPVSRYVDVGFRCASAAF